VVVFNERCYQYLHADILSDIAATVIFLLMAPAYGKDAGACLLRRTVGKQG